MKYEENYTPGSMSFSDGFLTGRMRASAVKGDDYFKVDNKKAHNIIKKLLEEGKLEAFIDKSFSFNQMAEAFRYIEEGHYKGHIAITIDH